MLKLTTLYVIIIIRTLCYAIKIKLRILILKKFYINKKVPLTRLQNVSQTFYKLSYRYHRHIYKVWINETY